MRFELPILFAARLSQVGRIVFGAHYNFLQLGVVEVGGNVAEERCIAAFMDNYAGAVYPRRSAVIHALEAQQESVVFEFRSAEMSSVPECPAKSCESDAAARGFR